MKRITTAVTEANRGHISDGLLGLAVLARRPGIPGGLDHFGFEVDDIELVLRRIKESLRTKAWLLLSAWLTCRRTFQPRR